MKNEKLVGFEFRKGLNANMTKSLKAMGCDVVLSCCKKNDKKFYVYEFVETTTHAHKYTFMSYESSLLNEGEYSAEFGPYEKDEFLDYLVDVLNQ